MLPAFQRPVARALAAKLAIVTLPFSLFLPAPARVDRTRRAGRAGPVVAGLGAFVDPAL